jgi:hypothetical protein
VGRWFRSSYCSSPDCEAKLTAADRTCPGCGGRVVGTIDHPKKRLDALDELENRQAHTGRRLKEQLRNKNLT